MITDIQERVCFGCKYSCFKKSPISSEYDELKCNRNRSAQKCYDGMYDDYEFV